MSLIVGQELRGCKATYQIIEVLKGASVFKAAIVTNSSEAALSRHSSRFAVIKSEPIDHRKVIYEREHHNYQDHKISSSHYIRKLFDLIGHSPEDQIAPKPQQRCMVFEWMESELRTVSSSRVRSNPSLPRIIAKSTLKALAVFQDAQGVHTDVNPNNILLSNLAEPSPEVKLADLGNLIGEGYNKMRVQSLPTRAPEVWRGLGCWHTSDVWSLGVTLLHWLASKPIFGPGDKVIDGMTEAWCIAKIIRLIGLPGQPVDPSYLEEFATANFLEAATFTLPESSEQTQFIKVGSLREELERLPRDIVSWECMDFIEHLLILDHNKRPSAKEALSHPYIR
ncbi:hypothetical protein MMC16_004779 [Acarospora aff. strigata]|nr:hypothetical protein [Acarospora aff. strigata]